MLLCDGEPDSDGVECVVCAYAPFVVLLSEADVEVVFSCLYDPRFCCLGFFVCVVFPLSP